jgi:Ca-activated chloride channel homolog
MRALVAAVVGLAIVVTGAATVVAQTPLYSSRIEGVRIDLLATVGGQPLAGLQAGDFEVRDNGVLQAIDLVALADVPVNVVLTLDTSASVQGEKLASLQRAGRALLGALNTTDAAALVTFNRAVVQQVPLTRDADAVRAALARAEAGGDTALVDAALGAMLLGDTDAGRTLVVMFSDGVDTASFVDPGLVLETARRVNGVVYGVSSTGEEPRFLRDLAAATGGRVLDIGRTGDPGPAFLEILQEFRRRYVITFTPTGVAAGGWHRLDVRVKRPGARVQSRAGYFSAR